MFDRLPSELRFRLRALFRRRDMERELDDELRFHLERDIEARMKAGVPRREAERLARLAFGGLERIRDDTRDARGVTLVEQVAQDIRYAVRTLRAHPVFAAGTVLTLALGIGVNATMFGIVDRLLFRAPPTLRQPETAHRVYRYSMDDGEQRIDRNFSYATYRDLQSSTPSITRLAAFQTRRLAVGEGDAVSEVRVTIASADFFRFFDAVPALGRFFTADDDVVPGGSPVVVLGYDYWQSRFGGRNVVGERLRVDRTVCTIIGVAPQHFVGMADQGVPAAYLPITLYASANRGDGYVDSYQWSWLELLARRRPDVHRTAAEAALTAAFRQSWRTMEARDPAWGDPDSARVRAALGPVQLGRGPLAGQDSRVALWISGVALIVLLITCANVANLLLSRTIGRRRELAMRMALGAGRGRLMRQLLIESLVLAVLGGTTGLALAQWGAAGLRRWFLPAGLHTAVLTDGRTLAFTLTTILAVALLTGLVSALHAARGSMAVALKAGGREGGYERSLTRTALLVLQPALSVVLLVGAGLFWEACGRSRTTGWDTTSCRWSTPRRGAAGPGRTTSNSAHSPSGCWRPPGRCQEYSSPRPPPRSRSGPTRATRCWSRASIRSTGSAGSFCRPARPTIPAPWGPASCGDALSTKPMARAPRTWPW